MGQMGILCRSVKEIDGINEMKWEVFKINEDGTIKRTVVKQEF